MDEVSPCQIQSDGRQRRNKIGSYPEKYDGQRRRRIFQMADSSTEDDCGIVEPDILQQRSKQVHFGDLTGDMRRKCQANVPRSDVEQEQHSKSSVTGTLQRPASTRKSTSGTTNEIGTFSLVLDEFEDDVMYANENFAAGSRSHSTDNGSVHDRKTLNTSDVAYSKSTPANSLKQLNSNTVNINSNTVNIN